MVLLSFESFGSCVFFLVYFEFLDLVFFNDGVCFLVLCKFLFDWENVAECFLHVLRGSLGDSKKGLFVLCFKKHDN